jgi:hypothetical protein
VGLACYDQQKNSWTSTFGGVNCLSKGSFSHCVYSDSKNRVWFGTEDGAICYDPKKGYAHPKIYNTELGLSDNSVTSIIEDYKGRIWIGTTCGLNQIDTEKGTINKYYSDNGLQSNEFSDAAACTLWGGKMLVMGGTGGINWFDTDKVKQHPWQAKVTISGLLVGNKPIYQDMESGIYTITDKGVYNSDKFSLSHEDNTFTIHLSTLTYNNVEQISYAYSINGEDWRTIQSGMNELSFSHMPAGTYKFRVKAICNGYETPVKEFSIIVHPAWYASIWARICYLLAFLGLCLLYIKHRKRKMEDQLILQQHIHAEEMGEAKLKFFMNISHEIRTPLTLIHTQVLIIHVIIDYLHHLFHQLVFWRKCFFYRNLLVALSLVAHKLVFQSTAHVEQVDDGAAQNVHIERLHHKGISARLQAGQLVFLSAHRCKQNHWNVVGVHIVLNLGTERIAVHLWHHDV